MKLLLGLILMATLSACSGGSSGSGGATTTYKYKVTGADPDQSMMMSVAQFTLQWNESAGVATGVYKGNSGTFNVTGTSGGSGRTLTVAFSTPVGIQAITKFQLNLPAGDLNGSVVGATYDAFNASNISVLGGPQPAVLIATTVTEEEEEEEEPENPPSPPSPPVSPPRVAWDMTGRFSCWSNSVNSLESSAPGVAVIDKVGDVYTWGSNNDRSLGHTGTSILTVPTKVTLPGGASAAIYVALGNSKGGIIDSAKKLYEFGNGVNLAETTLPMGLVAEQIEYSKSNTYILDHDGKVWVRGTNEDLQLGQGNASTAASSTDFSIISSLSNVKQILAHPQDNTIYVLTTTGLIYGWGEGTAQRFSFGSSTDRNAPTAILTGLTGKFIQLSRDFNSFMAVHENGTAYTWGNETARVKLGRSGTTGQSPDISESFVKAAPGNGGTPALAVMTAFNSGIGRMTYMIGSDDKVYKWGKNQFGDGLGTLPTSSTSDAGTNAVEVTGFPIVMAMKDCNERMFVVKNDGTVWGSGSQYKGGLGNGQDVNGSPVGTFTAIGSLDLKD